MHIRLCFRNPYTTLDLYEYTLDSERILAAYACLNRNFKLYNVTCDPQNKIVSSVKFKALLDSKTNITEIIYNGRKKIFVSEWFIIFKPVFMNQINLTFIYISFYFVLLFRTMNNFKKIDLK